MSEPGPEQPPRRFLLRPAGVLTQLIGAVCLLLGTISVVLVIQNKSGGLPFAIAWAVGAMAALVFGGLMARGGLVSVLAGATLDVTFGIVLAALDEPTLRSLLRLLPASDVDTIAAGLHVGAIVMGLVALLCIASVPQARRYHRALREAEQEAEASGMWSGGEAGQARAMPAAIPTTLPGPGGAPGPTYGPPGPTYGAPGPTYGAPAPTYGAAPGPAVPTAGYGRGGAGSNPAHSAATTSPLHPPLPPPLHPVPSLPTMMSPPGGPDAASPYAPPSSSTRPGWTPNPARTYTTMMIVRPPAEAQRSRRRVYFALGGVAIGVGIGVGVLVSSTSATTPGQAAVAVGSASGSGGGSAMAAREGAEAARGATADLQAAETAVAGAEPIAVVAPTVSVRTLITAQREAIARADAKALAALVVPGAFAFGLDAADVAEGRDAIEALFQKQLAEAPPDGFTVASKFLATGQENNHAWSAEEIELSAPGEEPRRIAITQLAAFVGGSWSVVAVHWGRPVPDELAERQAILGTLPQPAPVPNRADGGGALDAAVRTAFASRAAFAEARSEREDGFNFGSAPGERIVGGGAVKRVFGRLRSELRLGGGARVVGGGAWDPEQASAPWIGFAAVNVDYTQKTRAATDLTHTFRVLAVFLREGDTWKIVQTQFSHGGPIR